MSRPEAEELAALRTALADEEGRFAALIRGLQVGVVVQGPRSEILEFNPKALELLGLTADQLRGSSSADPRWNIVREDGASFPAEERPVMQAIRTRRLVHDVAIGVFRPAVGDRVWLLVSAMPQLREDGSVVQVVATFTDVTRRREAEIRVQEQAREIEALSTPLIPLDASTLLMPLLGRLGRERVRRVLEVLLHGVRERRARVAILDVTGVPELDAEAAAGLRECVAGLRLLGARCLVTGIRPAVAASLVELGLSLDAEVFASLERALAAARSYAAGPSSRRSAIRPTKAGGSP